MNPPPPALRLSLADLMALVALVAAVLAWPGSAIVALPLLLDRGGARLGLRSGRMIALVFAALYLPTLGGFFILDCAHCRGVWSWAWPVVPGGIAWLLVGAGLGQPRLDDRAAFAVAALASLGLIGLATALARCGPRWRAGVLVVVLAYSSFATWVAAALIRA